MLVKDKSNYCQLCIDYESNKYIWKIFLKKKKKLSSYQFRLKLYYILLYPKLKVNFCTTWKTSWLKRYMPTILYLSSYFRSNKSITASLKSELHLIPVSEMRKFHTLVLKLDNWPFGITATWYLTYSDHSNKRIYRKPIDKRLKTLLNEGSGSFLRPNAPELWKIF